MIKCVKTGVAQVSTFLCFNTVFISWVKNLTSRSRFMLFLSCTGRSNDSGKDSLKSNFPATRVNVRTRVVSELTGVTTGLQNSAACTRIPLVNRVMRRYKMENCIIVAAKVEFYWIYFIRINKLHHSGTSNAKRWQMNYSRIVYNRQSPSTGNSRPLIMTS